MQATKFNRDNTAKWYAKQQLLTDPGISAIYFLPANAGEREIRFLEVNGLLGDRNDNAFEPIDFGIDRDTENAHTLILLDVTPEQFRRIESHQLQLPPGWSLEEKIPFVRNAHE